ncbi:MAG TPA: L,D-transpeptidase family protein [Methyloceanibacter sp.]|nr:L,D-transpeptidase family protein [Methyloceanibacter sp.]
MRLSGLRLPKHAYALFLAPLLAFALVAPAGAEPSTQYNGDLPSAADKSAEAAGQPESDTQAAQPEAKPEAAQSGAKPEADKTSANAAPAKIGSQILVNVDKSLQEMTVFVDGIEKYQWPVSTGLRGYSTPSGNFTASSMNKIWYSKQWDNAPMPHAIFFTKDGHAIHGSYETKKLGRAASHGCVRLAPKNAETLFHLVEANGLENTKVVLAGVTPGGEAKVAAQPSQRYRDADAGPWGYYPPPRGLFGWQRGPGWGPAYAPPPRYREQRRGWFQRPRGYY